MSSQEFSRPSSGQAFSRRRGPAAPIATVADTTWADGIPAVAAEHRGSLADAEADAGYRWAAAAIADRDVLDLGCGVGHGSALLRAAGARSVLGVDSSSQTIEIATRLYGAECRFLEAEPSAVPLSPGSFGAIVCLSALEKTVDPEPILGRLAKLLAPGGILLVSLPLDPPRDPIDGSLLGPAHRAEDWAGKLGESFAHVSRWRRRIALAAMVGSAADGEAGAAGAETRHLGADPAEDRSTLIAASSDPLPALAATTTTVGGRDLRAYRETVAAWEQRARMAEADGSAKHWELVASREAQRRLRKRLWQLEHRPLRRLWRVVRGRPAKLTEGPPMRPPEMDQEDWI